MRLACLAAALAAFVALAAPAASPARRNLDRDDVMKLLRGELRERGLEVKNISLCRPKSPKGTVFRCNWRAEGKGAGDVHYMCAGYAKYWVKKKTWFVQSCENRLGPEIPILPKPGPQPQWFGYNEGWHLYGAGMLDMLAEGGGTVARQGLIWSAVERTRGHYDWDVFDQLYDRMLARGIRPLFILTSAPCWAQVSPAACRSGHTNLHPTVAHYGEFADFAAAATERYPEALGMEVWNEPNFDLYWGGRPDAGDYARMFKEVQGAINDVNPAMPVITAGLSPHASDKPGESLSFDGFLRRLYELGAAQRADAIAVHPYPTVRFNDGYIDIIRSRLGQTDRVMRAFHDAKTPMWVTRRRLDERLRGLHRGPAGEGARRHLPALPPDPEHRGRHLPPLRGHAQIGKANSAGYGVLRANGNPKQAYCRLAAIRGLHPC